MKKSTARRVQPAARPQVMLLPPFDSQAGLTAFAAGLNRLEQIRQQVGTAETVGLPQLERAAWKQAEAMLDGLHEEEGNGVRGRGRRLAAFGRGFTVAARDATLRMEIRSLGRPPALQPVVAPLGAPAHVFALLWCAVFPDKAWTRLRRCQRCAAWSVDHSDNQSKKFCGDGCKDRFHDRGQRRRAGHKSQRRPSKARRRIQEMLRRAG